jgi:hypothetical protein
VSGQTDRRAEGWLGERTDSSASGQLGERIGGERKDGLANGRTARRADGAQRAGGRAASRWTARRAEGWLGEQIARSQQADG